MNIRKYRKLAALFESPPSNVLLKDWAPLRELETPDWDVTKDPETEAPVKPQEPKPQQEGLWD